MANEKMIALNFVELTDEELMNVNGGISKAYAQAIANETSNAVSTWSMELSLAMSAEYFYY